jgi:hypothetical protein
LLCFVEKPVADVFLYMSDFSHRTIFSRYRIWAVKIGFGGD